MNQIEKSVSFKKILANRENAKRSTGPKSVEGKSFSRRNALKHGLRADNIITVGENKAEFEEFNLAMIKELKPFDMISMQIVNRIILWLLGICNGQIKFKVESLLMKCKPMRQMNIKVN
jgi:hypothetical protein